MRLYINEIKIKDDILYCYTEDSIKGLSEVGQMLVDSDNYAFAYTLDDGKSVCLSHFRTRNMDDVA